MMKMTQLLLFFALLYPFASVQAEQKSKDHALVIEEELKSIDRAKEKFASLSAEEKKAATKEANSYAARATVQFRAKMYDKASENFAKSLQLDPTNNELYQNYAISLIKSKKYAKGLAYLRLTKNTKPVQRFYYFADAFRGLEKNKLAASLYDGVKATKDKRYAPSAAFQKGLLLYKNKDFDDSKEEFEFVLDYSQDPRLDQQAENLIERILRSRIRQEKKSKRFHINGLAALQFDSNILFNPDNVADQGSALDDGGQRYLLAGTGKAKLINTQKHEAAFTLNSFYMLSKKQRFRRADPFLVGIGVPYTYKGKLFGKNHQLTVSPGFQLLYLDANDDDKREKILESILLDISSTFVMSNSWISNYSIKLSSDDSKLTITSSADDSDAKKISLFTNQTFILNKAKKVVAGGKAGTVINAAEGSNKEYLRIDLSAFYSRKLSFWDLSWANSLRGYQSDFTGRTDNRKDTNISVTTSFSRPVTKWMKANVNAGYTKNSSNIDANKYTQWTVMTALSFDKAF